MSSWKKRSDPDDPGDQGASSVNSDLGAQRPVQRGALPGTGSLPLAMPLAFYVGQLLDRRRAASRITRKTGIVRSVAATRRTPRSRLIASDRRSRRRAPPISPTGFGAARPMRRSPAPAPEGPASSRPSCRSSGRQHRPPQRSRQLPHRGSRAKNNRDAAEMISPRVASAETSALPSPGSSTRHMRHRQHGAARTTAFRAREAPASSTMNPNHHSSMLRGNVGQSPSTTVRQVVTVPTQRSSRDRLGRRPPTVVALAAVPGRSSTRSGRRSRCRRLSTTAPTRRWASSASLRRGAHTHPDRRHPARHRPERGHGGGGRGGVRGDRRERGTRAGRRGTARTHAPDRERRLRDRASGRGLARGGPGRTVSSRETWWCNGHEPRLVEPHQGVGALGVRARGRRVHRRPATNGRRGLMAVVLRATWTAREGSEEAMLDALRSIAAPSRQEPGCRLPALPRPGRASRSSTSSRSTTTREPSRRTAPRSTSRRTCWTRPSRCSRTASRSSKRSTPDAGAPVNAQSTRRPCNK